MASVSIAALTLLLYINCISGLRPIQENTIPIFEPTLVYKWVTLDYIRPSNMSEHQFRMTYPYDYRNTLLGGLKVYKGDIYVTVPRINRGVSATLNRVVEKDGAPYLEAFPNWDWQTLADCEALQTVNNIEIDPVKGWMWIIDTGRVNTFWGGVRNLCQPKLIIYDIDKKEVVIRYVFPPEVASITDSYLSDIVIDPEAGFAYISDLLRRRIIFYSMNDNFSIAVEHALFAYEYGNNTITIDDRTIILANASANIDGIALSPRRDYVVFSHLGGFGLYRISTEFFRKLIKNSTYVSELDNYIKRVGFKPSQSRGIVLGHDNLYFGALGLGAVYSWQITDLLSYPDASVNTLRSVPQARTVADDRINWIDTVTLDTEGILWITSSNLVRYFLDVMDYHHTYNYYIWKVDVGEDSYLKKKTSPLPTTTTTTTTTTTPAPVNDKNAASNQGWRGVWSVFLVCSVIVSR